MPGHRAATEHHRAGGQRDAGSTAHQERLELVEKGHRV